MRLPWPALLLLLVGCGETDVTEFRDAAPNEDATATIDGGVDAGSEDAGPPADPIVTTPGAWTWVDFPDSRCDEGTPTGIGVNSSIDSSNVLVFLNGGGACWDYSTCFELNTSTHGPYTVGEFNAIVQFLNGGLFDRNQPRNPFRDWSFVFVPYCTGDLHAGNNVATYPAPNGGPARVAHHVGHANIHAYLRRLKATFPNAQTIVLSGASAGGYGTLFTYPDFKAAWPNAKGYLIDDSGPPLPGDSVPQALRDAQLMSWRLDLVTDPICGLPCRDDSSIILTALAARYPNDRMALLSSLQDSVIRSFAQQTPQEFEAALLELANTLDGAATNFKYFFVPGESHVMLGNPADYNSRNINLADWLIDQVTDDAGWASTRP